MSTIKADTVQPKDAATDLTLGASGDTVTVAADSININKVQDKGGNTLWDYSTGEFVSTMKEFASQSLKLLSTSVASGSDSISFTTLIDSTYSLYIFKFINMNPATDNIPLGFNGSTDSGSSWAIKTTTFFRATHSEDNVDAALNYVASWDLAQSTDDQRISIGIGSASDECASGELHLFAPSSTTYVKHWNSRMATYYPATAGIQDVYTAGYFNTTSAINTVRFKMSSGMFDGTIKMYGLL